MREKERDQQANDSEGKEQFLRGLKRYSEKGVPVYIDNHEAGPDDWEKLTQVREDNRFYMGDFVQNEYGELREIRFDMVYHGDIGEERPARKHSRKKREEG